MKLKNAISEDFQKRQHHAPSVMEDNQFTGTTLIIYNMRISLGRLYEPFTFHLNHCSLMYQNTSIFRREIQG